MGKNDVVTLKWERMMARDHLGSADDGAQRARGIIDSIAQILDFLLQQESRHFRAAEKFIVFVTCLGAFYRTPASILRPSILLLVLLPHPSKLSQTVSRHTHDQPDANAS